MTRFVGPVRIVPTRSRRRARRLWRTLHGKTSAHRQRNALNLMCKLLQQAYDVPDSKIDTSDIPEVTDWTGAERGKFYRPK